MDPFVGEIRIFAGAFSPVNWHYCDGSLLRIDTYQMLYSLIGTIYGGDGRTTFALPDLRGRLPVGQGTGPSLTPRAMGQVFGSSSAPVTVANLPLHTHSLMASTNPGTSAAPSEGGGLAACAVPSSGRVVRYAPPTASPTPTQQTMAAESVSPAPGGGDAPSHVNLMPYLCVNYIICLNGLYPDRP